MKKSNTYIVDLRSAIAGFTVSAAFTFVLAKASQQPVVAAGVGVTLLALLIIFGLRKRRARQSRLARMLSSSSSSSSAFLLLEAVAEDLAAGSSAADIAGLVQSVLPYRRHPHTSLLTPILQLDGLPDSRSEAETLHRMDNYARLAMALRSPIRDKASEHLAKYITTIPPSTALVLYGYSSTVCDGIARASEVSIPSIIVVEDVQYGSASIGEHAETLEHLSRAGIAAGTIPFENLTVLLDQDSDSVATIDGDSINTSSWKRFVAVLGCDALDDIGRALIPAIANSGVSETAEFVSRFVASDRVDGLESMVSIVVVAESFKAVSDVATLNPRTHSPVSPPWWIRVLHALGLAVAFRGSPVRLQLISDGIDAFVTDAGVALKSNGSFDLKDVRMSWLVATEQSGGIVAATAAKPRKIQSASQLDEPDGVIFDCNGVLVHDEPIHFQAFAELCSLVHGSQLSWSVYEQSCMGRTDEEGIQCLIENGHIAGEIEGLVRQKSAIFARSMSHVGDLIDPQARELLKQLASRGIKTSLITANTSEWTETFLAETNIEWAFEPDLTRTEVGYPRRLRSMQALILAMGLDPAKILLVDDSIRNLELGESAGLRCLRVRPWLQATPHQERYKEVGNLGELIELINWV